MIEDNIKKIVAPCIHNGNISCSIATIIPYLFLIAFHYSNEEYAKFIKNKSLSRSPKKIQVG